eukprot:TRINITY_DN11212_c1_g1_i1.p1 TRINITY_DN11212_c1_g1~~TRINITY_DN11212_c1_g1_i1.p1  ORF type:complete len:355 (-),score=45.23 TRINITY_DN11212_c1_g1_i1:176-1240(-)
MAESPSLDILNCVDESYLSGLLNQDGDLLSLSDGDGELLPISDEQYAVELQFQELMVSSVISSLHQNPTGSPTNEETPMDEAKSVTFQTGESSKSSFEICKEEKQRIEPITIETGEAESITIELKFEPASIETGKAESIAIETGESLKRSICEICIEEKGEGEIFKSKACSHVFCSDCISKHVAAKIQENIITVQCPDLKCGRVLEPEFCRSIIPVTVFERWENALCESMVLGSQKFYCPFKDCSALLVNDGEEEVVQSECPSCRRLFCARCYVTWHSGIDCEEFQGLGGNERGRDDLMAIELAVSKKWKRCPTCKFYVEKAEGCLHITCRCGFEFCYVCGLKWSDEHHASCHT